MAKSRSRGAKGRGGASSRSVRSTSGGGGRRGRETATAEVVEDAGGGATWEAGVAFATFIALLVALILLDMHMSASFDAGKLF